MTNAAAIRPAQHQFYGKPFMWVLFALVMLVVPAIGFMVQRDLRWDEMHPAINAMLNGSSAVFLIVGRFAIRRGRLRRAVALHRTCMIAAFTTSSVFLASYLMRFYVSGTHRYPGLHWDKVAYLLILFTHMILAAVLVPLVLRSLYLGLKRRYDEHKRLARWTWPIWMYVSVTGVLVYLMLYPIANAIYTAYPVPN